MTSTYPLLTTGRPAATARKESKEKIMPHIIVKLWPGKTEQQKKELAERITKDVMDVLDYGEESVSVTFEEISANVYR